MMKIKVGYPGLAAEKKILQMYHAGFDNVKLSHADLYPVCNAAALNEARAEINAVQVEDGIFNYIVSIVETTRRVSSVRFGASPRASVSLLLAAKAYAAMNGRDYIIPDDVRFLVHPVLRHRILLAPEAEIEGITPDQVMDGILAQVKVPR
jgi:MoxR-like ATPase